MTSIQPTTDQPWQLQHPPAKWQEILHQAIADMRDPANPNRDETLKAIKDANEALNTYEDAANVSPSERINQGLHEGVQAIPKMVNGLVHGVAQTIAHPIQTIKNIPKIPGHIASEFSPEAGAEQNVQGVADIGNLLLPMAKTSRAAGAATVGEVATAPITGSVRALFQAGGDILRRPGLRNAALEASAKRAGAATALSEARGQLIPKQLEQAGLRTQLLQQQLERGGSQSTAAMRRIALMEQQLERGPATAENLALRNELMRLKLEIGGEDIPTGEMPPELPPEGGAPVPTAPKPTVPPSTPEQMAPDALRDLTPEQFQQLPGGQTPPLEQSAAAPGASDALASRLAQAILEREKGKAPLMADPGQIAPNNPLNPNNFPATQEFIENQPGNMGQKAVQFGEGSPLSKMTQDEIKNLLGQVQNILGKR